VSVGNIKPYKNIGRLVEAFIKVAHRIPHDLVIIGQFEGLITGESPDFFRRVREAGDRVHMTGFVSPEELLALVGHAQALVMPSTYEGFGLPPLEAMAASVPAAVARSGSLPEVCGDAALYFDPANVEDMANQLLELAQNPTLCASLRQAGERRAALFTWDSCARTTAAVLRRCLKADDMSVC
jgi:glycosyltransferase involved in cell wall biosynthesis